MNQLVRAPTDKGKRLRSFTIAFGLTFTPKGERPNLTFSLALPYLSDELFQQNATYSMAFPGQVRHLM